MFPDKLSKNLGNDTRRLILESTIVQLLYKWEAATVTPGGRSEAHLGGRRAAAHCAQPFLP